MSDKPRNDEGGTPEPAGPDRPEQVRQMVHELRGRLATVLGYGDLLASRRLSPSKIRAAGVEIQQAGSRMEALIGGLAEALSSGDREEIEQLQRQIASLQEERVALDAELREARLAQQQLESYAEDFRQTYAESRNRLRQMTALYEVSSAISSTVDPREVLTRTVEGVERLLPEAGVAVYLLLDNERIARRAIASGPAEVLTPAELSEPFSGPVGQCLEEGRPIEEGPGEAADEGKAFWSVALPLASGSRKIGALLLIWPGRAALANEQRYLAEMVASQTAMAVENARLATTDVLTGLFNRRYFEGALDYECERARRSGRPLGLLMIDIDHFKRFNDHFGHPAGDEVLRLVAGTLASQFRRTDIVARIGGEEFAAILPEDDHAAVIAAAERLRRAVEHLPPLHFEGRQLPGVRISVGGTSMPAKAVDPPVLVSVADSALRQAKQSGRNRAVITPLGVLGALA